MFEFVSNETYRKILNRDFAELEKCMQIKASKSAVVMSGSIIESILIEYFIANPPTGKTKTKAQVLKLKLSQLIDFAEQVGLISKKIKNLSSVVRDYRNYIHPAKEVRMREFIDEETAKIAFSLLKMIVKEVQQQYTKLYGITAEQLFNKIWTDSSAYSIFEKLIGKTNKVELEKLAELIIAHYIENSLKEERIRTFTVRYLKIIKPKLDNIHFRKQLMKLKEEVEHGQQEKALKFFDLYGERLDILDQESTNLIVDYIYSVIGKCDSLFGDNLLKFNNTNFYDNLKLYNNNRTNKENYLNLILSIIVSVVDDINYIKDNKLLGYINIYETLTNYKDSQGLFDFLKKKVGEKKYAKFQSIIENNYLPF